MIFTGSFVDTTLLWICAKLLALLLFCLLLWNLVHFFLISTMYPVHPAISNHGQKKGKIKSTLSGETVKVVCLHCKQEFNSKVHRSEKVTSQPFSLHLAHQKNQLCRNHCAKHNLLSSNGDWRTFRKCLTLESVWTLKKQMGYVHPNDGHLLSHTPVNFHLTSTPNCPMGAHSNQSQPSSRSHKTNKHATWLIMACSINKQCLLVQLSQFIVRTFKSILTAPILQPWKHHPEKVFWLIACDQNTWTNWQGLNGKFMRVCHAWECATKKMNETQWWLLSNSWNWWYIVGNRFPAWFASMHWGIWKSAKNWSQKQWQVNNWTSSQLEKWKKQPDNWTNWTTPPFGRWTTTKTDIPCWTKWSKECTHGTKSNKIVICSWWEPGYKKAFGKREIRTVEM